MADQETGYRTGRWKNLPNYECGDCAFATLNQEQMIEHVQSGKHLVKKGGALAGIDFASDEAAELAAKLGVRAAQLRRSKASGVSGYTVADVRAAAPHEEV